MHIHAMQLLSTLMAIPIATALVMGPIPPSGNVQERTPSLEERASPSEVVDLTVAFNNQAALTLIAGSLPKGTTAKSGVELAWMPWGDVPGPVKPRAKLTHLDTDPVIRAMLKVHVNTPWWCAAVTGHIVYYIFPDNSGLLIKGVVDSWDTLTDIGSACESEVNSGLQQLVPTKYSLIQALVDAEFARLPDQHFGTFALLPAWTGSVSSGDVELVLQSDSIVSRWNYLCMDVQDASLVDGAHILQNTCNGTPSQKFDKVPTTEGFFKIRNQNSGMCVMIDGNSSADGSLLIQQDCTRPDTNEWSSVDPGTGNTVGAKWLVNRQSGLCVDVPGWSTTPGTLLQQLDCVGGWKDYWYDV